MGGLQPVDANPIELFAMQYCPHYLTERVAPFHRTWYNELNDKSNRYLLLEAIRGSGKTTCASIIYSLFELCEGDGEETILRGEAQDQAALYGLIAKLRDLGLTLVSVNEIG